MSTPAVGYSVGNLAATTISGTVPYKPGSYQRNSQIQLYIVNNNIPVLLFTWFLKTCTIYNESSITFTGIDAMAFTNNNYTINEGDTIGMQYTTATGVVSTLCGAHVVIERPNFSESTLVVDEHGVPVQTYTEAQAGSQSVKTLMESAAKVDCANYYTECTSSTITLKKSYGSESNLLDTSNSAPLSKGVSQSPINFVRVFQTDMEIPTPNVEEHETLADYGIWEAQVGSGQPTPATTMKIVTPYMNSDIPISGFVTMLSGKSFGTEFSCSSLKVPGDTFFIPMSKLLVPNDSSDYYICSADYRLTTLGVYASVSGTAKAISDYEFVGETSQHLRQKVELEHNYHGSRMSIFDGMTWSETSTTVAVNNG